MGIASRRARLQLSTAALAVGALAATVALGVGSAGASSARAKAARTLNLRESANLHESNHRGIELKEQGRAKGTLVGSMYIQLNVPSPRTFTASIQVYPKGGSLVGYARGSFSNYGSYASFTGTLSITKGSGTYSKAKGSGLSFSGTDKRSNGAVTVRMSGKLSY